MQPKINHKIGGSPVVVFRLHCKNSCAIYDCWGFDRATRFSRRTLLVCVTVDLIRSGAKLEHESVFISWIAHSDVSRCAEFSAMFSPWTYATPWLTEKWHLTQLFFMQWDSSDAGVLWEQSDLKFAMLKNRPNMRPFYDRFLSVLFWL